MVHYIGLQTYTTVVGAPETVPEFREVDVQTEYPLLWKKWNDLQKFSPNKDEQNLLTEYGKADDLREAQWRVKILQSQIQFLTDRRSLVHEIVAPPYYGKLQNVVIQYDGMTSKLISNLRAAEGLLEGGVQRNDLSTSSIGRGTENMSDYTRAWIDLTMDRCVQGLSRYPTPEAIQSLGDELSCWSTKYEIPPGSAGDRIAEPTWWQDYLNSSQSQRSR
jgi:hypothetical protein